MATLEESIQVQVNTRSSLPPQDLVQLTLKSGEVLQFPDLKINDDPAKHRDAMGDGPVHIGEMRRSATRIGSSSCCKDVG